MIETSAAAGSFFSFSVSVIASFAARWKAGSIVVYTRSPPDCTVCAPYFAISWSRTKLKKYGSRIAV